MPSIKFVERSKIDIKKWNDAIDHSPNGLIYGYADYLDHMAPGWSALVENDYERIMPLPSKRKYGIAYIYQPFLVAQLGIFGKDISQELTELFLSAIPPKFKYWDINFNHLNKIDCNAHHCLIRNNYVLDLNRSYDHIRSAYRENTLRNIKKCWKSGAILERNISIDRIIEIFKEFGPSKDKDRTEDLQRFRELYLHLFKSSHADNYAVVSVNGDILASAVFFYSHERAYYIFVGNHPNGRTIGASHALINAFIQNHAGQQQLLDFEGSDIKNLAFFYSSFGANEENFPAIKENKLPFYLKWLKQ